MTAAECCEGTKNRWIVCVDWVHFQAHELYLNRAVDLCDF